MLAKYVDVHCHPNLGELKSDQDEVISRMKKEEILGIVVGVDLESSRDAVAIAEQHDHLWATVGLHPNYTDTKKFNEAEFETLVTHPKVVAIGECGLDYFRPTGDLEEAKRIQHEELEKQVQFAAKHNKPLMVHCRPSKNSMDSYRDFLEFIGPYANEGLRGNMHFFVGNLEVAKEFWSIGFTTSFTGVLTFTEEYDEVVREAPLDMILTETDAPYAAPVPYRGQRNEPAYISHIVSAISRLRGIDEVEMQKIVLANARRMFTI